MPVETRMRSIGSTLLAGALLAALAPLASAADTPPSPGGVTGVISGSGFTPIKIAIPDPDADAGSRAVSREIGATVRADLQFSGYFDVLDPGIYPLVSTSPETTVSDKWASIGAASLALSKVAVTGDRLDLRVTLVNTSPATRLSAQRYGGTVDLARRLAHQDPLDRRARRRRQDHPSERGRGDHEHLPGLVPRRPEDRLCLECAGKRGDLPPRPGRRPLDAPHELSGDRHEPVVLAERARDRVHLRPLGVAADLRDGRGRPERPPPHHGRGVRGRGGLVAARRQDRVRVPARGPVRHRGRRRRERGHGAADPRRGEQREPAVVARRAPSRLRVEPRGPVRHLHDARRRRRRAPLDPRRRLRDARLVAPRAVRRPW